MPGSWIISAAGRTYGPYTIEQLRAFAAEGRLARQSLVARAGETEFRKACDEPALGDLFAPLKTGPDADLAPVQRRESPMAFGRSEKSLRAEGPSHFVIIADMKSGSITRLEETIV